MHWNTWCYYKMKNSINVCKNCDCFYFTTWEKMSNQLTCLVGTGITFAPHWDNYDVKNYILFDVPDECKYKLEHIIMSDDHVEL